jgi:hypothetical protein
MGMGLLVAPAIEVQVEAGQPASAVDQEYRAHVTHPQVVVDQFDDLHVFAACPGGIAGLVGAGDHGNRLEGGDGAGNRGHVAADAGQHGAPDVAAGWPGHPGAFVWRVVAGCEPALAARGTGGGLAAGRRVVAGRAVTGGGRFSRPRHAGCAGYGGGQASQHSPAGEAASGVHRSGTAFLAGICGMASAARRHGTA